MFRDAAADPALATQDLFTLNHDTLLESYFGRRSVADGFGEADQYGIRRWDPSTFDQPSAGRKVRLFKLHGSVDWRRFAPGGSRSSSHEEFVGTRQASTKGRGPFEPSGPSFLLTGIFNKLLDYNHHVFLELHHRFYRVLAKSEHIVVCGYGFGDKGVNQRIIERMTNPSPCGSRLLIIDPAQLNQLTAKARVAVGRKIGDWQREGRFIHWQRLLGDPVVTWDRIVKEFIRPS